MSSLMRDFQKLEKIVAIWLKYHFQTPYHTEVDFLIDSETFALNVPQIICSHDQNNQF